MSDEYGSLLARNACLHKGNGLEARTRSIRFDDKTWRSMYVLEGIALLPISKTTSRPTPLLETAANLFVKVRLRINGPALNMDNCAIRSKDTSPQLLVESCFFVR